MNNKFALCFVGVCIYRKYPTLGIALNGVDPAPKGSYIYAPHATEDVPNNKDITGWYDWKGNQLGYLQLPNKLRVNLINR